MNIKQNKNLRKSHTYNEILLQPQLWQETLTYLKNQELKIDTFLKKNLKGNKNIVVLFVGAGTSEFIGNITCEYFAHKNKKLMGLPTNIHFESRATTDIIPSAPIYYDPVLIVSFARSGESPESLAAIEKIQEKNKHVYNLVITCNPLGKLSKNLKNDKRALVLEIPKANDKGFAMTSSFSCMLLISYFLFASTKNERKNLFNHMQLIQSISTDFIENKKIVALAEKKFERIVFLGSSVLGKVCQEASLKMLELTAGNVAAFYNTPMGFRHGPKSIINSKTLIVFFMSSDKYIQKYDLDLIKEISSDKKGRVILIAPHNCNKNLDVFMHIKQNIPDYLAVFPCVVFAQLLALQKSCILNFNPDNPFPKGTVNRVVQGVKIYEK